MKVFYLFLLIFIVGCTNKDTCKKWALDCNNYYLKELAFKEAYSKQDIQKINYFLNTLFDTLLTDSEFLTRFEIIYIQTGLRPVGFYEVCDTCSFKYMHSEKKTSYRIMVAKTLQVYLNSNDKYSKDTLSLYSLYVNRKYEKQIDSGLFTPKQYIDTLKYFIKNKIEVDLGG